MASGKHKAPDIKTKSIKKSASSFIRHYAIWLFVPIPAILGMVGFSIEGEEFWDSAFSCLTMYLMEYGDPVDNVWIQVARWLAPVATASGLTMVFTSASRCAKRFYASTLSSQ